MEIFIKEELQNGYYPCELILINQEENGEKTLRFAVNYYPGVEAIKVLCNNTDIAKEDASYAYAELLDPNNMCVLSNHDKHTPFKSAFIKDFVYGTIIRNNPIFQIIKSSAVNMLELQKHKGKLQLSEILAYEKHINDEISKIKRNNILKTPAGPKYEL